jgi:aminopeptidase N
VDHPEQAFDFAVQHEQAVLEHVEAASKWAYIPLLAATSTNRAMADKVQAYTERSIPADARDASKRTIAYIRLQAGMKDRQVPALESWLRRPSH